MKENIMKYCELVKKSSVENEKTIKLLYDNKLYNNAIGILRMELELYVKTLYLVNQNKNDIELLLDDFFNNIRWRNEKNKILTERIIVNFADKIGYGWERISYKFACSFIHLSILQNWTNEDVTQIISNDDKKIIIQYINQYHNANLSMNCKFEDIVKYLIPIFNKIQGNLECYIKELEKQL